jgi:hypothetical protein
MYSILPSKIPAQFEQSAGKGREINKLDVRQQLSH